MLICKVVKPLVSTNRIPDFEHKHLQVVLDGSTQKVAVDAVGAIPGDWVICVGSSAAREAAGSKSYPSDLTIVGIIDHWDPDAAKDEAARIAAGGPVMEIMQVVGSLVCTQRVGGLDHSNLRVLRTSKGKLNVAVDPVGASPGNWVFTASGSAARWACPNPDVYTDLTIGGIIDFWEPDG